MTQEQIAAKANMDRSYISDVERGTASLSVDRLLRICSALGISAAIIMGRIEQRIGETSRRSRQRG